MTKRVLVIIPAYNEELVIGRVIADIHNQPLAVDIVVINDGSRDETAAVASAAGAKVLTLPTNLGIGGAMQTGYRFAAQNDYDIAVQLDADGQHDPGDLERVVSPLLQDEPVDMVVGSRYVQETAYRSSAMRRLGMVVLSLVVRFLLGYPVHDTTSGYRAVNRRVIQLFSNWYPTDYPEPEALVYLHRNGFRIREVSVSMHERGAGKSSITPIKSAYYMIKVLLSLLMNAMRARQSH